MTSNPIDILVLGFPGAGKTALLDGLKIASAKQAARLGGSFTEANLYKPGIHSDLEADLPIQFQEVQLEALKAEQLQTADALIVLVDGSQPDDVLQTHFDAAAQLVDRIQDQQQSGFQVGGFPVSIALTKCDLLAHRLLSYDDWISKVEERRKDLANLFNDLYETRVHAAFGSLRLKVYPTASKLPDTSDTRKDRDEPFGLCPLFRETFEASHDYQERGQASGKRLRRILIGAAALCVLFFAVSAAIVIYQTTEIALALEAKLEGYQAREGQTASIRLATSGLSRKRAELLEFKNDSEFVLLPKDRQETIQKALDEIEAYTAYREDLGRLTPPAKVRSLEELARLEESLAKVVIPPTKFKSDWSQTEAVQTAEKYKAEAPQLRSAVADARAWYSRLKTRGNELLFVSELSPEWEASLSNLLNEAGKPPAFGPDRLRSAVLDFREVQVVRGEWSKAQDRLRIIQDLGTALGLVGNPAEGKAVLLLTDADVKNTDALKVAQDRDAAFRRQYPDADQWSLSALPDPLRPAFLTRLNRARGLALQLGRTILEQQTASDVAKIAEWLPSPIAKPLREFLAVFDRLAGQSPGEVEKLLAFLREKSFTIQPKAMRLFIPDQLREFRLRPDGKLTIALQRSGEKERTLIFKQEGEGVRDRNGMGYLFTLEAGGSLSYLPGDTLWAVLPLKEGEKPWRFEWVRGRSKAYQFERLALEPALRNDEKAPIAQAGWADGVKLTVTDGSIPLVPDLLP